MALIAIDRYQAINSRFYRRISNKIPISITIKLIWIIASLFSIPNIIFRTIVTTEVNGEQVIRCLSVYPEPQLLVRQSIVLTLFVTQYIIPLTITSIAYIKIVRKIRRKNIFREYDIQQRIKKSDQKIIKMLAIVVIVFALCWLPLDIYLLIYGELRNETIIGEIFLLIAISSVCYNPFIYFGLNTHFRKEAELLFGFIRKTTNLPLNECNINRLAPVPKDGHRKSIVPELLNRNLNDTKV